MEYISSDTCVWIDFALIDKLELPFRLPYIYVMNSDSIEDEMLNPPDLSRRLLEYGLHKTELKTEEFYLAEGYAEKYPKLSKYDRIALAIAKVRSITLLTGDKELRNAAKKEGVPILGTIGILDQLLGSDLVDLVEYHQCIMRLQEQNGKKIRLPEAELEKRLH